MHLVPDAGFTEVADRVWVARHTAYDVNVTVVGGERGLLVVDTNESEASARADIEGLRRLVAAAAEVAAVVNTHEHFDHWFGNGAWRARWSGVPLIAHDEAAAHMVPADDRVPADTTFSSVHVVDLGDRVVELIHPGRGHTGGDIVLRVEDADVLLAGDLLEESGTPGFGADCFPMSWPLSLDLVLGLIGDRTVVVPGHGDPVGIDFVEQQRAAIGVVAETIRDLASRGVPVGEALDAAEWPYPAEALGEAVRRGYDELPRAAKHLPLI